MSRRVWGELIFAAFCLALIVFGYCHGRQECPAPIVFSMRSA